MLPTPRPIIDEVILSRCGTPVVQLTQLSGGGRNEAYRAELASGASVVVRIARQPTPWFINEPTTTAQARSVGVPVPEVIAIESVDHHGEILSFSVLEFVAGRPLDEMAGDLPRTELERLIGDAGELLARLHSLSPDTGTPHGLTSLDEDLIVRATRAALDAAGSEAATMVEQGAALVSDHIERQPEPRFSLSHGDWLPKHLMIDDQGDIASVIDWEFAGIAPPARDLAHWGASARSGLDNYATVFRQGYGRLSDPDVADEGWVPAFAINFALEVLSWANPASSERQRRCLDVIGRHLS